MIIRGTLAIALLTAVVAAGCGARMQTSERWQGIGLSPKQESVCARIENAGDCARAIEKQRWSRLDRFATRKDGVLELSLANGKTRKFQDTSPKTRLESAVRYSLIDFVRSADSWVVFELSQEESKHLLVRRSDGVISKLDSAPVFSPDGSYFVTASATDVGTATAIRVYRTSPNASRPKMEWSLEPGTWGPGMPRWLDEATIQIPTDGWPVEASKGNKVPSDLTVKRSSAGLWYAVLNFESTTHATN